MQTFRVEGMTCSHCERAVTSAVQRLDPQASVSVDLSKGVVTTDSEAAPESLMAAIAEEGYKSAVLAKAG